MGEADLEAKTLERKEMILKVEEDAGVLKSTPSCPRDDAIPTMSQ